MACDQPGTRLCFQQVLRDPFYFRIEKNRPRKNYTAARRYILGGIISVCPDSRTLEYPVSCSSMDFRWVLSGALSFRYVEGRRTTDFIGAALSVSFIFSSGFVKTVAGYITQWFGTNEFWLPFITGLVFSVPLLICVYFLEKIPAPSPDDIKVRSVRMPMSSKQRSEFVRMLLPGLIACIGIYVFATVFRDIRDNFMADMLKENGYGLQPALFTKTEVPVTLILLVLMGSMILVRNNVKALVYTHYIIMTGFLITALTSLLFIRGSINAVWWLTFSGLGLYTVYIPFNCIFFERLIASFRVAGNVGFLIYVADSFGYLGSVGVLVTKEVLQIKLQWTSFYAHGVIILSVFGIAGAIFSLLYFAAKHRAMNTEESVKPMYAEQIV